MQSDRSACAQQASVLRFGKGAQYERPNGSRPLTTHGFANGNIARLPQPDGCSSAALGTVSQLALGRLLLLLQANGCSGAALGTVSQSAVGYPFLLFRQANGCSGAALGTVPQIALGKLSLLLQANGCSGAALGTLPHICTRCTVARAAT